MRFCTICENRLETVATTSELYHQCTKCKAGYPSNAEDTLRYRQVFNQEESTVKYDTLIRHAAFDNANPRIYKSCPSCNKKIVSYIVIGENMNFVYACTCGNRF